MPATIKDVARVAGCSIKTVSRVINSEPNVTAETRHKVQAAIRSVGYAPNISARRLVQNKSYILCILMYPGFYQPASEILSRIMDVGYEENYDVLIQPYTPSHPSSRKKLVNLIYEHRIDGVITTPPIDADDFVADMLSTYKVPQVQINPFTRSAAIPFIAGDDAQGAYAMTEYLIDLGHRRIAFIMGPANMRPAFDRLSGYRAALDARHIPYDEGLVRHSEWTFEGGLNAARALLAGPDLPQAIFAANDETAFGAMYAAQERGHRIPEQLSVCGYEDIRFSNNMWPGLTTVHQPTEELVDMASRTLINVLKGKSLESPGMVLPAKLVIRQSTGRASRLPNETGTT